jgi:hypothetical protein
MATTKCRHERTKESVERCFGHCVASNSDGCNSYAHGGITWTETCLDCGMVREHNANGRHGESSHWHRMEMHAVEGV